MRALLCVAAAGAVALGCGGDYGGDSGYAAPAPAPSACTAATATSVTSIALSPGNQFVPACARVPAGVAVTFTNGDGMLHTVTTDAGQPEQFDSGNLSPGATFPHSFAAAGTVQVHCSIHPEMRATIIVQ
jgi:plastocyanin